MSKDGVHVFPVRVYYEDTDAAGIVYYANYLRFAERARTELLRDLGIENGQMNEQQNLAFVVKRCSMDFVKPAKLDDMLAVETRLIDIGGASVTADQRVRRDQTSLVTMELKLACMAMDGRPARLPVDVRRRLEDFGVATESNGSTNSTEN
ncbi:MAG: tol-pal system-associated acyl-CoA thioesterase [Proteobacteria bacterium]|nr:tol-pal system-associated acyl-CoA thioesterase [Pseudomonadota bacterium]